MATYPVRFTAIADAFVNGTATQQQKDDLANALVGGMEDQEIADAIPGKTRATLTSAEKTALAVEWIKRHIRLGAREGARADFRRNAEAAAEAAAVAAYNSTP